MATYNPNNPSSGSTLGTTTGTTGTTGTTRPTGGMGSDYARRSDMASSGMETAETETPSTGGGVTSAIGERLERAGQFLEDKGKGQFVADKLHTAGKYLQENDARTMARSIDSAICAHPYRGILIGLGVGWVVGRFLSGRE